MKRIENLQEKFDEKIKQYKSKILDYKTRLLEKQKELDETIRKTVDEQAIQDTKIALLEQKVGDQRESYEKKILDFERENENNRVNYFQKC